MYINKMRHIVFSVWMCVIGAVLFSCADDLNVGNVDTTAYENSKKVFCYVKNLKGPNKRIVDLYNSEDPKLEIAAALTKPADFAVDVKFKIDASALATYNKANETDFEMLPANLASIENEGCAVVPPGTLSSIPVYITLTSSDELTEGKTYALPISVELSTDGVELTDAQKTYMYFIKAQGNRLNPTKPGDLIVVSCMGDDTNPLNNGEVYLKETGQPLFDIVVLFSANINLNAETGRVNVHCNRNIRNFLDNREKYLVPLQKKGIKIVMGILGNRDQSGVANLTRETATYYAQELKAFAEAYELDGYFFDDEYSNYAPGPGFEDRSSNAAASRLLFETKRAMPDKLCLPYNYATTARLVEIDGVNPGQYIDYVIADYPSAPGTYQYPGSVDKQIVTYAMEFALNKGLRSADTFRSAKYQGGAMIFAFNPSKNHPSGLTVDGQIGYLNNVAQGYWDQDVYWTGVSYPMDW